MTPLEIRAANRALLLLTGAFILSAPASASAQSRTGGHFEMHVNEDVTASAIGLPDFPNATSYNDSTNDARANLGFDFGDVHFRLLLAKYVADAPASRVFDFYRKALSRYGDVLECEWGRPVGSLTRTAGGLTCSANWDDHDHARSPDDARDLRAGAQERFRVVAIERSPDGPTRFTLMLIEVPKHGAAEAR